MVIHNGKLHRCSISGVLQRCVSPEEGQEILREIHEGDCGHHAGSKSLVAKAFRHGFESVKDQVSADVGGVAQSSKPDLMARGVAVDLLQMAKRVGP